MEGIDEHKTIPNMKNMIICSIAVLSAALLAACTETTRIWPEEGESKAYVEVSSQKVIFDADGGNAVITVATNADGWDYAAEGDWFTVARQDGNALLVETLINAGAETLTGKLTVSAEKNGAVTALVRFLDYRNASGAVCTGITWLSAGYLVQSTTSAPLQLVPVLRVDTDVYSYYVNIVSGEVSRVSA